MKLLSLLIILLACTTVFPGDLADDLIKYSGIGYEIKNLPEQFIMGFEQGSDAFNQFDPELKSKLNKVAANSFDYDKSIAYIKEKINQELSDRDIKKALQWLQSDLGKKITAMEDEMSKPENAKKALEYTGEFDNNKKELIDQLISAVKVIEKLTDMSIQAALASSYALAPFQMPGIEIDLDIVKSQIESMRPVIKEQMKALVKKSMNYGYKDLSVSELKKYVKFNLSDVGINYNKTLSNAQLDITKKILHNILVAIIDYFKEKGKNLTTQDI